MDTTCFKIPIHSDKDALVGNGQLHQSCTSSESKHCSLISYQLDCLVDKTGVNDNSLFLLAPKTPVANGASGASRKSIWLLLQKQTLDNCLSVDRN